MNRSCRQCGGSIPITAVVDGRERNLQRRKFCLQCSPFGGHNTRRTFLARVTSNCRICGKHIKNNTANRGRCSSCNTQIRRIRAKTAAVKLLGGKCKNCGWSGHLAGFEFHHAKGEKEFAIGNVSNKSWSVIKHELKKCELLCSICHRIHHATSWTKRMMDEVSKYNGTLLET